MPSPNIFYAFRIIGEFAYVKTRSVPKQEAPLNPEGLAAAELAK